MSTNVLDTDRTDAATHPRKHGGSAVRMLESAKAAAARGDHADALTWLRRLEELGHQLDSVYAKLREEWRSKVKTRHVGSSQWFG